MFSEKQLEDLRIKVGQKLSGKRYLHTLGVEKMAKYISEELMPSRTSEIRAAALLHDISKELSDNDQIDILKSLDSVSDSDFISEAVYHSLTAPEVIKKEYPEFATADILSAVKNHTTGAPDMSLFDEIIFISDYIEEGRTYSACITLREDLMLAFNSNKSFKDPESALHDATIKALDNTIIFLVKRKLFLHEKTVMTRNAFWGRRPMPLIKNRNVRK